MNTTCIAILGMHRSGTSALTRALNLCGVVLPGQMMDNTEGNASGHWEPLEVVAIHDEMLATQHLAWDDAAVGFADVFDAATVQNAQAQINAFLAPHAHSSFIASVQHVARLGIAAPATRDAGGGTFCDASSTRSGQVVAEPQPDATGVWRIVVDAIHAGRRIA